MPTATTNTPQLRARRGPKAKLTPDMVPTDAERRAKLLARLEIQAETDLSAARLLLELTKEAERLNAGNVVLNITSYDIEDKKLAAIIAQADVSIVLEILDGLRVRLEADGFPAECRRTLQCLRQMFQHSADTIYAPPED